MKEKSFQPEPQPIVSVQNKHQRETSCPSSEATGQRG